MRALRHLRQLVRVAEEDELARGRPDGERVGERELPGLVHEERVDRPVELVAGEEPRRPGDELELRVEHRVVRLGAVDEPPLEASALLVTALLPAAEAVARLDRGGLDLLEELMDRLVAERSHADALAAPHPLEREPRTLVRLP